MLRWVFFSAVLILYAAAGAGAQATPRPPDPVFVRAQELVSDGRGAAGRALIDSVIAVTPQTSQLYPQALFWRASLAANAADAESDYRHIVVDYPLAPQAEDALLRLAQLELARGDRDGALVHLRRIARDYPRSKSLARANYWTARVLFEKNDMATACAANAEALAQAAPEEVELRNQIQYQGQRCASYAASVAAAKATSPTTNSPEPGTASTTPVTPGTTPKTATTGASGVRTDTAASESATKESTSKAADDSVASNVPAPLAKTTTVAKPPAVPATPKVSAPAAAAKTSSRSGSYSVQVAAYNRKAEAEKLATSLSKRGYAARVDGNTAPFRVRIGRYRTAVEASEALKGIKAKSMEGFVVRAPER